VPAPGANPLPTPQTPGFPPQPNQPGSNPGANNPNPTPPLLPKH
jgi:hypothetical protein